LRVIFFYNLQNTTTPSHGESERQKNGGRGMGRGERGYERKKNTDS